MRSSGPVQALGGDGRCAAPQGHVGHGIGLDLYEPPMLATHDTKVMASGMALCLENPIFAFGTGALTLEDTVVVEPGGMHRLTHSPRDIQIITSAG